MKHSLEHLERGSRTPRAGRLHTHSCSADRGSTSLVRSDGDRSDRTASPRRRPLRWQPPASAHHGRPCLPPWRMRMTGQETQRPPPLPLRRPLAPANAPSTATSRSVASSTATSLPAISPRAPAARVEPGGAAATASSTWDQIRRRVHVSDDEH